MSRLVRTHPTACLALMAIFLVGCGRSGSPDVAAAPSTASHRRELGKLKYQRDKVRLSMSRLEDDRTAIINRIKQAGVDTKNLAQHPDWRIHALELKDVVNRIRQLEKTQTAYDQAITRMELILRKEDRDARLRGSALSDKDLDDLSRITHELEDQLRSDAPVPVFEDLELELLLTDELQSDPTGETQ